MKKTNRRHKNRRKVSSAHGVDIKLIQDSVEEKMMTKGQYPEEDLQKQLETFLLENSSNEEIIEWIEINLDEGQRASTPFIHALVTSVCRSAVDFCGFHKVNHRLLFSRSGVLKKYLDDQEKQLEALNALTDLMVLMNHPKNLLWRLFVSFFENGIIEEDVFYQWKSNKVPGVEPGKHAAVKSVSKFFDELKFDAPTDVPKLPEGPDEETSPSVINVRASHSQNDDRYSFFSRNNQCTCNALTFLAYHNEGLQFDSDTLDAVLERGDGLYTANKHQLLSEHRFRGNLLNVEEIPQQAATDTTAYNVHQLAMMVGKLNETPGNSHGWLTLEEHAEMLITDYSHALLVVCPDAIAVFRDPSGRFGIFDSHSRDASGMPTYGGRAIMLMFPRLSDLVDHLHQLFECRSENANYEFVPLAFEPIQEHDENSI